ncbi:MAG: hypothetical protein RL062_126 [Bacteroidota bacterium]
MIRKLHLSLFFIFLGFTSFAKDKIIVNDVTVPVEKREAILLLNGFGSLYHTDKNQIKALAHQGFDLLIPDYIDRKSIQDCVKNVESFYQENQLSQYKAIHVFSYIVGSWTVNQWIAHYHPNNIASIIYDRSALQETVPQILDNENPFLSKVLFGKIMHDIATMPYPVLNAPNFPIAMIIECKASHILYKKREGFAKLPSPQHNVESFRQPTDNFAYYFQSHDDLYTQLDQISADLIYFYRNGHFPNTVQREPCMDDPFKTYTHE